MRLVPRLGCAGLLLLACLLAAPLARAQEVPQTREEIQLSFAPVVKKAAPAVVNIYATRTVRQQGSPLFNDPFFQRFFGESFPFQQRERQQNSLGSGVIVSPEGLIVTNHHVIARADEIKVVLADLREFSAEIVLDDESTDLAVLRVDPGEEKLPALELRDSDDVEVGDLVLAIGNPFGVGQTVTSGIVSALSRTQVGVSDYNFFIQTDAAINPGNSGGALVTLDGRLIGVNTAIYSKSGGSVGIGFAVPSNMVRTIIASAGMGDQVVRPWIGFTGQTLTMDLAEGFGLARPGGVVVNKVYDSGPAAAAGLQAGDVILTAGGQPVPDVDSLRFRFATGVLGESLPLSVWRERGEVAVEVPLQAPPRVPEPDERVLEGNHPLAGAKVANLSPALAEELEIGSEWEGVVVLGVYRGSPAARLGLRARDMILTLNGSKPADARELDNLLASGRAPWSLKIERDGRQLTWHSG
ncbi:DegQ family serine endoprotease [Limibacillus halophilus]|jgi:Do/DeqQ family serine protease